MENTSANSSKKYPKNERTSLDLQTFIEFVSNAKENISLKNIANLTILTLMGRLRIKHGKISVKNVEIVKGKEQKKYLIKRNLVFGKTKLGEIFLGGEKETISLSKNETDFIEGICQLSSVLIKNIENISKLKETNRELNRKILQFESLFETSKELLLTPDIEKAVNICMNIISGSIGIMEIGIKINRDGKEIIFLKNIDLEKPKKGRKKIEINYITAFLGKKLNGKTPSHSDIHFAQIVLNLLYTNIENLKMIEQLIEKEKLEKEIKIAREIQRKLLPEKLPEIEGLSIKTEMITYNQVGGDYYDIIPLDKGKTLIIIADVSGKGVPASLIMSAVQSSIKTMVLKDNYNLTDMANTLNKLLISTTEGNKFVAMSILLYDKNTETIEYLNAGHTPPLLFKKDKIIQLRKGGPVIGLLDFAIYQTESIEFEKGDFIFMYTDGISEAENENGEEFGENRIIKILKEFSAYPDIDKKFMEKFFKFSNGKFKDDITYIYVKRN